MATKRPSTPAQLSIQEDEAKVSASSELSQVLSKGHREAIDSTGETHHKESSKRTLARSHVPSEGERLKYTIYMKVIHWRHVEDTAHRERKVVYGASGRVRVVRRNMYEVIDEALDLLMLSEKLKPVADLQGTTTYDMIRDYVDSMVSPRDAGRRPKKGPVK